MFSKIVTSVFAFLETEFGFLAKPLNESSVQYELGDSFVRLSHSTLDEVSLRVGALSRGFDKSFSAGVLIALTSPAQGFALRDRIVFRQEHVEQALRDLAQVLRDHGQRVLIADSTVFDDLQRLVDNYWADRNSTQIRQRAEMAFAAKNFAEALHQYRMLGERRKPLDAKRMELCEHNAKK
jgi:hypothetical protein